MQRQVFEDFSKDAVRKAQLFMDYVKRARDIIKHRLGDDADDYPDVVQDTLYGEMSDVDIERTRNAFLAGIVHEDAAAENARRLANHYAGLAKKHEERSEVLRDLLVETLTIFGEVKWKSALELGTVYTQKARDKVEVTSELDLPASYFKAPEPAMSKINADIKAGKEIPGVTVTPGAERDPIWIVRPSKALKEGAEA